MLDQSADRLRAVTRPLGEARGLPNRFYTDPAAWAEERRALFHDAWSCIGFASDAPEAGDACPVDHLGAPLVMVRGRDGVLRVFENVCRHRGMILVPEARRHAGVIRCPYHSWCYAPEGRLVATPHVGGPGLNDDPRLDRDTLGLTEVRAAVWMDCVFVTLSAEAPAFDDWIAPLAARWADFADRPLFRDRDNGFTLDLAANWKLAVENYCESYHLPWIHPGLNSYSRLEDHHHIEDEGFSGQGTTVYAPRLDPDLAFPDFPDLPARWDTAAEYVALYPNVLLGVHRDHAFAIRLEPLGQTALREHVALFYTSQDAASGAALAGLRAKAAALWKEVFEEDVFVVEGMQRGRGAPGFDGGVFSPAMDGPTHRFHAWAALRLGAGAPAGEAA